MTRLGSDWKPDDQGIPRRQAGRAVIFSPNKEVLLMHGHDGDDPQHQWWFTVGGGIAAGESPKACVLREIKEETGLKLIEADLVGPVLYREAEFRFRNVRARQDEWFFLVHLDDHVEKLDFSRLTDSEQQLIDDYRWFSVAEMKQLSKKELVYPLGLAQMCEKWQLGWDGECLSMIEDSWEMGT